LCAAPYPFPEYPLLSLAPETVPMKPEEGAFSVVMPARNEAPVIGQVVSELARLYPDAELLVVDDGSTDDTARLARAAGARVISHPYSKGNGAAIKTGARAATRAIVVFMDADGQHLPAEVAGLVAQLREREFDMVVGARDAAGQATVGRHAANTVFNRFATWMVGHRIEDLTSGFRAVRRDLFNEFLYLLPNGLSDDEHHGFFPVWLLRGLSAGDGDAAPGEIPHQLLARRVEVPADHLPGGDVVFASESVFPGVGPAVAAGPRLLLLHLLDAGALHQHERLAADGFVDNLPLRAHFRADHGTDLQTRPPLISSWRAVALTACAATGAVPQARFWRTCRSS
jgi:hypothetical protein